MNTDEKNLGTLCGFFKISERLPHYRDKYVSMCPTGLGYMPYAARCICPACLSLLPTPHSFRGIEVYNELGLGMNNYMMRLDTSFVVKSLGIAELLLDTDHWPLRLETLAGKKVRSLCYDFNRLNITSVLLAKLKSDRYKHTTKITLETKTLGFHFLTHSGQVVTRQRYT